MKLRMVILGIVGFTCAVFLILVPAWAVWLSVEKGNVRAIQDEMRAEGLPMTAADLEPPPLAEADNAAPLLERAAELLTDLKKREGWIDAVPGPGVKGGRNPAEFDPARLQRFREQMAWPETQEALRLLREAATKPGARFERDVSRGPAMDLGPVSELLAAGRLLGASAWLRARDGDASGAVADLRAAAQLGGFLNSSLVLIDWLVAITLDALSVSMASGVLAQIPPGGFEPDAWDGLSDLWGEHRDGLRSGLLRALDGERVLFGGWIFERMGGGSGAFEDMWRNVAGTEVDRRTAMALAIYTHPWSPLLHADHAAYLRFMRDTRHSVGKGGSGAEAAARIPATALFTRLSAPALDKIPRRAEEIAAQLQLGRVGLSLERWRTQSGRLPAILAALRLPPSATTDPFSGQSFIYRVEGDGVLLYSVGSDRKDDGATTEQRRDLVWQVSRGSGSSAGP